MMLDNQVQKWFKSSQPISNCNITLAVTSGEVWKWNSCSLQGKVSEASNAYWNSSIEKASNSFQCPYSVKGSEGIQTHFNVHNAWYSVKGFEGIQKEYLEVGWN